MNVRDDHGDLFDRRGSLRRLIESDIADGPSPAISLRIAVLAAAELDR